MTCSQANRGEEREPVIYDLVPRLVEGRKESLLYMTWFPGS